MKNTSLNSAQDYDRQNMKATNKRFIWEIEWSLDYRPLGRTFYTSLKKVKVALKHKYDDELSLGMEDIQLNSRVRVRKHKIN